MNRWFTSPLVSGVAFTLPFLGADTIQRDARRLLHAYIEQKKIPMSGEELQEFDTAAAKLPIEMQDPMAIDRDLKVITINVTWDGVYDPKLTVAGFRL